MSTRGVSPDGSTDFHSNDSPLSPSRLPPEVWAEVISRIIPDYDSNERSYVLACSFDGHGTGPSNRFLRNVSLTCWLFHNLALPIRFRTVEIHTRGKSHTQSTRTVLFIRLSTSQKLRNFVKDLRLWIRPGDDELLPESTQGILCGMPNLRGIHIRGHCQITPPIYNHFCSLHSLLRLQINSHISFPKTQMAAALPNNPDQAPTQPIYINPTIPSARLATLHVLAPSTPSEMEDFKEFVRHTPLITDLTLERGSGSDSEYMEPDLPFPSELLPALQRFEGDIKQAGWIVPSRPVEEIVVTAYPWGDRTENRLDDLHLLGLSTVTVRSFRAISVNAAIPFSQIVSLFPDLEDLRTVALGLVTQSYSESWLERGFVSDVSRLRQLRTLTVSVFGSASAVQEKALLQLPSSHPLEWVRFSLCHHLEWDCKCSNGSWRKSEHGWFRSPYR